ncbi:MAG: protein kinase [Mycolicibacterium hassiacum]
MSSEEGGSRLGTRFGPYELRSLIGVGGMGEVYRAYDTERDRLVAIKLLRPELAADPNFRERFRRESRVAARLSEPHVIPVHDFGEIDGVLYIDMRLVDGASLKAVLANEGALEPARAVSIIRQVASALDAAHANGLVHRDIKPENVLLTRDDFAYVVDFGIAQGGGDASVTSTGLVVGSSAYMAPERFSGERGGPASDVYSLTCLLYETLTGRAPFDGADVRQVMSAHMFSPPPRPSIMRRGINRAFDEVVARGMAKQPRDRYRTAGELAEAAAAAAEQFRARGYRRTSVDDVVAAAGVARGTFYKYFSDKQDLLVALAAEIYGPAVAFAHRIEDVDFLADEATLRHWLATYVEFYDRYSGCIDTWAEGTTDEPRVLSVGDNGQVLMDLAAAKMLTSRERPFAFDPIVAALILRALVTRVPQAAAEMAEPPSGDAVIDLLVLCFRRGFFGLSD